MVGDVEAHEVEVDTEREELVSEETEVSTNFIPGGSVVDFLPGGDNTHTYGYKYVKISASR